MEIGQRVKDTQCLSHSILALTGQKDILICLFTSYCWVRISLIMWKVGKINIQNIHKSLWREWSYQKMVNYDYETSGPPNKIYTPCNEHLCSYRRNRKNASKSTCILRQVRIFILLIYFLGFCNEISFPCVLWLFALIGYKLQEGRNHNYFVHSSVLSNKLNACHTEDTEYIFIKYIN